MTRAEALAGKWVLVTGASSGLGRRLAERLVELHRADVILVARRDALLTETAARLAARGGRIRTVALDLTAEGAVARLAAELAEVDELAAAVLCAGVTHFGEATGTDEAALRRLNALNVDATTSLLLQMARQFGKRGQAGRILIVSSMAAIVPVPFQAAYGASKAYVSAFVRALRHEPLSGTSITIAYPLGMDTDMTRDTGLRSIMERHPLGTVSLTRCADKAIADLIARRPTSLVGVPAHLLFALAKLLPRSWLSAAAGRAYGQAHAGRAGSDMASAPPR